MRSLALLIIVLAAYLRLHNLVPVQRGLLWLQDYDEAVWDSTAQLLLQGYMPYRDFFATLPPAGIYLLAGVLRLVYVPWGSGVGLMATRYASVVYGLVSVVLAYLTGRKLAGQAAGLVAAGLLAVDGMVISMDRMAMLEPPLNLFSLAAVMVYLYVFDQTQDSTQGKRLAMLAGVLAALAALVKTQGMVMILALLTVSLLRRRLWEALNIVLGFGLAWLGLSAYFLLQCSEGFLRQVYFFQFLRPADGVVNRLSRLYDIWHYEQTWLTVRLGIVGGLLIGLQAIRHREARPWWIVLTWAGYTMALIIANSSYYPQYYVQLAVPLCLLGGGLLDARMWLGKLWHAVPGWIPKLTLGNVALIAILGLGIVSGQLPRQPRGIAKMLGQMDATYINLADYIRQHSAQDARVLVFEPNYTFLASRPPAGAQPGRFIVDSYGEMLYLNLGIQDKSLLSLTKAVLTGKKYKLQPMFWDKPAQVHTLAAFERAEYVVIDGRARYQLEPQTLAAMQARSTEVFASGVASLRKRDY